MRLYQSIRALFLLSALFFKHADGSNLNGTAAVVYKNQHHVFSNGESALGYVRMNGGFTVKPGATATLDTVVSVSGSIDLRETGVLQLLKDLNLDAGVTWSSGGYIKGRSRALILNDTLSIPASKIIHISDDTIIDGNGNTLLLNDYAQIFVDNNVTLTLRNLVVCNTKNNVNNPCLRISGNRGKLALDNVELAMANDMALAQGQLYFHNEVIFTGSSTFIYNSPEASFITRSGVVKFDKGTTFSFAPTSTADHLFKLQDKTSTLYLNGCTLKTTSSGMRLTKGNLILDNKIVLESNPGNGSMPATLTLLDDADYTTTSGGLNISAWHPNGNVLAIGGQRVLSTPGFANHNELRLFSFDGASLTALTSQDYGTNFNNQVQALAWTPDGRFLAVGGTLADTVGGFANTDELRIYSFNGSTLTAVTSQPYGTAGAGQIYDLSWNPDGKTIALVGRIQAAVGGFPSTDSIRLYSFNGTSLTALTSQPYGPGSQTLRVAWSPDGKTLAIGGGSPTAVGGFANTDQLRLYSFNGSTLTALTSSSYGSSSAFNVYALAWSPDGKSLAFGGDLGGGPVPNQLRVCSFTGNTLKLTAGQPYGIQITWIDWSPDGKTLAVTGQSTGTELFDFSSTTTLNAITTVSIASYTPTVRWAPNGKTLSLSAYSPTSGNELQLYSVGFSQESFPQSYSRSIIFGNSALGSSSNLNAEVLGAAHVTINGIVNDDSV
jgi:Tol biopolymer transport system component